MKFSKFSLISIILAQSLFFTACGESGSRMSNSSTAATASDNSVNAVMESMMATINSATNDVEQISELAKLEQHKNFSLFEQAYAAAGAACGIDRFSPTLAINATCNGTTNNSTVTANFDRCLAGNGAYSLLGVVKLTFDSNANCNSWVTGSMPNLGTVTRTIVDTLKQMPDNVEANAITTDTKIKTNYLNQAIGGGVLTVFQNGTRNISILGVHRYRVFNHSIHTTAPIVVSGKRADNTRTISSGTLVVDHNILKFTTTTQLTNIKWSTNCCYPTQGSAVVSVASATNASIDGNQYTFYFNTGSCGKVNVADADGLVTSFTMASCL